jgi:hypothetical protein
MASLRDKVRNAKVRARKDVTGYAAGDTVVRNSRAAGLKDLTTAEFKAAKKSIQPRMELDRKKTAARAVGIEKREVKKAAATRAAAAIGNPPAKKRVIKPTAKTAKFNAATKAKEAAKKKK